MTAAGPTAGLVVFATCAEFPQLVPEDRRLAQALERRGIPVSVRIWSEESAWVDHPALVVIRSCWDYHRRLDHFLAWLGDLESQGIKVTNPPRLIRWNARKRYLLELQEAGLPIGIPTALVGRHSGETPDASLARAMATAEFQWSEVVVKPEVSGQAWETHRLRPLDGSVDHDRLLELVLARDCIIQPFVPDITRFGELSLTFLGGKFSHAVLKEAAPGDYRVQDVYGGTVRPVEPDGALLEFAVRVLQQVSIVARVPVAEVSYARIDLVNALPARLMEVEVIEPSLFLECCDGAAELLAGVLEAARATF